jgi:hypothetical protein
MAGEPSLVRLRVVVVVLPCDVMYRYDVVCAKQENQTRCLLYIRYLVPGSLPVPVPVGYSTVMARSLSHVFVRALPMIADGTRRLD